MSDETQLEPWCNVIHSPAAVLRRMRAQAEAQKRLDGTAHRIKCAIERECPKAKITTARTTSNSPTIRLEREDGFVYNIVITKARGNK